MYLMGRPCQGRADSVLPQVQSDLVVCQDKETGHLYSRLLTDEVEGPSKIILDLDRISS